ncbi:MAG: DUF302 domain-containing protein [Nitrospinales bacterium]
MMVHWIERQLLKKDVTPWLTVILGVFVFASVFLWENGVSEAKEYKFSGGTIIEKQSTLPFRRVISKIERAIKGARLIIVGEPNYQLMQRMVGRERKGAKGFFMYRPDLGIPIFDADPRAAMEIPLKIVIWEGPYGKGIIRYKKPSSVFGNYEKFDALGKDLDKMMEKISNAGVK